MTIRKLKRRAEYLRPWKLVTLTLGIAILIVGAQIEQLPDWDTGISILMSILTYLSASWVVRVFVKVRWKHMPAAFAIAWFSIDGVYFAWNAHYGPEMVDILRQANWYPSLLLYLICGFLWMYRGSMSDLATNLKALLRRPSDLG